MSRESPDQETYLQKSIVGHGVIHPEQPRRDVVGDEDVDRVMTVGQHDEDDAKKGDEPRKPVERTPLPWRVLLDDERCDGEDHCMATVDVVAAIDVLAVDR